MEWKNTWRYVGRQATTQSRVSTNATRISQKVTRENERARARERENEDVRWLTSSKHRRLAIDRRSQRIERHLANGKDQVVNGRHGVHLQKPNDNDKMTISDMSRAARREVALVGRRESRCDSCAQHDRSQRRAVARPTGAQRDKLKPRAQDNHTTPKNKNNATQK